MYLLAMLVATQGAWGGLGTVIGTIVGFLGGIYLPIGDYSETMANIIKFLPVIYGTKLFRTVMTEDVQAIIFKDAPAELINEYRLEMGVDLEIFSYKIPRLYSRWSFPLTWAPSLFGSQCFRQLQGCFLFYTYSTGSSEGRR